MEFEIKEDSIKEEEEMTAMEPSPPPRTVKQIGKTSISSVNRKLRSTNNEYLESIKDVKPKIESVFLDDSEYHPPEVVSFSIDAIKNEDSDDDDWQNDNYEDSADEPFSILKVETVATEVDEKPLLSDFIHSADIKGETSDDQSESDKDDEISMGMEQKIPKPKPIPKPQVERCIPCNRKFHDMSKHWIQFHSGIERPYECFVCHRNYKRFEHIKYHMKTHGDERNYICHVCGDAFFLSNELRKHIMNRHQVERPYKCTFQQCKKCFKNQHALNVHMRTHTGIKPHVCSACSESFAALSSLKIHERKHTGEKVVKIKFKSIRHKLNLNFIQFQPYVCKFCHKAFADCSTHKQHVRVHTGDKVGSYQFNCIRLDSNPKFVHFSRTNVIYAIDVLPRLVT